MVAKKRTAPKVYTLKITLANSRPPSGGASR